MKIRIRPIYIVVIYLKYGILGYAVANPIYSPGNEIAIASNNISSEHSPKAVTCDAKNLVKPENWEIPPDMKKALSLKPNLENGLEVYEVCVACHLDNGWGRPDGTFPQIAGQHRSVLTRQLADLLVGKCHPFSVMCYYFMPLSRRIIWEPQALADVTGYIAQKLLRDPNNGVGSGDDLAYGKKLYKENCVKCHCKNGEGNAENFYPRIHGQHYKYMLRQFEWIRDGKRRNANPEMVRQIKNFTERDMKAVLDYASRLKPPKELIAHPNWTPCYDANW